MHFALHTTSRAAIERAAEAARDVKLAAQMGALAGSEALDELSFQQLLDLRDEVSDDGDWDALSDIDVELAHRRDEGKDALERRFIQAMLTSGTVPMTDGGKLCVWLASVYLAEALATDGGVALAVELLLRPLTRSAAILTLAREYVAEQSEDLLRAGWTEVSHG